MKTILVTGIEGFTGKYVARELRNRGYHVVGLAHVNAAPRSAHMRCDLTNKAALQHCLSLIKPDGIIHLAALSFIGDANHNAFYDVNLFGSLNILESVTALGLDVEKIILASSANVYGNLALEHIDEYKGKLRFDSIQVNKTAHLFGDTAKPACNLIINFSHPVQSSDELLKDSLNDYFLSACFGDKYTEITSAEAVNEYVQTYIEEYRRDLEPMYREDEKDKANKGSIGNWYSYYKSIKSNVQFYEKGLLVYHIYYDEFTGGAHGIYLNTYFNIDLNTMQPLHLSDLFVEEYQEALTDLIWNQLMTTNNVTTHAELEDLGYGSTGEIAPSENFFLDKEGITFYYNVYDITPYAMGPVKVHLSFDQLTHLLGNNPILGGLIN